MCSDFKILIYLPIPCKERNMQHDKLNKYPYSFIYHYYSITSNTLL